MMSTNYQTVFVIRLNRVFFLVSVSLTYFLHHQMKAIKGSLVNGSKPNFAFNIKNLSELFSILHEIIRKTDFLMISGGIEAN